MPHQPLCDLGGCDTPSEYSWKKYVVCGEHLQAHFDEKIDLDVYFALLEQRVHGGEALPTADYDDLGAFADFLFDSMTDDEEAGQPDE